MNELKVFKYNATMLLVAFILMFKYKGRQKFILLLKICFYLLRRMADCLQLKIKKTLIILNTSEICLLYSNFNENKNSIWFNAAFEWCFKFKNVFHLAINFNI